MPVVAETPPPPATTLLSSPGPPATLPVAVQDGIDAAVASAIAAAKLPGCVVVIGRHDSVLFTRAYGSRSVQPSVTPMTLDTVFDLASLTKPVATAASILALVDRGRLDLDAPLRTYLPELGADGRGTLRQVLTHTAGFPSDTPYADYAAGMEEAVRRIAKAPLRYEPGAETHYSDVGFLLLGEVVRRVSGKDLATFAHEAVFAPLAMDETTFLPPDSLRARAAPTEKVDGRWLVGEVHDPRSRLLGGIAGHAGLFSTAHDLTLFAQSLLGGGKAFLSPRALSAFTAPHDLPGAVRALGWDVRSRYSTNRGMALSPRAFGHGGYTGTSLFIDPTKDLFVLFLSNRVHPDGHGAVNPLAGAIADLAATSVGDDERVVTPACDAGVAKVETGLDVLDGERFARLRGANVGLITNASGRTRDGRRDVDLLAGTPGVRLVAIFAPEHGLATDQDAVIADGRDAATGLPVFSLYGEHLAPTDDELAGIDTLVFDLPDVGTRFFTYASTLHRVMATAASHGLRFVVLDRPDPIDGVHVEGPVLPASHFSFVNHASLPIRHGMTMGELALLLDATSHLGTALDVVRARGWTREQLWSTTDLPWVPPSPNLRTPAEALLYPGIGLLEATNVSVGRGTDTPFEVFGAPWIDGARLASALAQVRLAGVRFEPTAFTPTASKHKGARCSGLRFTVTDASTFAPVKLGVALAVALHALYPGTWDETGLQPLLMSKAAADAIARGAGPDEVIATWDAELVAFRTEREKFLLYATRVCPAKAR
jgi:uncharacterized protein YbbC (DUF1343 family)